VTGQRLADFATHAAPDPDDASSVPHGAYYRVLHNPNELATPQNTHAWIARTPDGEWGSLRIGAKGAAIDEHADGTISVAGVLTTRTGRAWRLERGEWMRAES